MDSDFFSAVDCKFYRVVKSNFDEVNNLLSKTTYENKIPANSSAYYENLATAKDTVTCIYDKTNRLMTKTGPNGRKLIYDYDKKGKPITTKTLVSYNDIPVETDDKYDVVRYEYNVISKMVEI